MCISIHFNVANNILTLDGSRTQWRKDVKT